VCFMFWRRALCQAAPRSSDSTQRNNMHAYVQALLSAGFSTIAVSSIAPLFFGGAHLHHLWQQIAIQKQPLKRACLQQLAQFSYTTLFGVIANLLFLHTGSLASPVALHVGCNWLGLPATSSKLLYAFPAVRAVWAACAVAGLSTLVAHMATANRALGMQCLPLDDGKG
jgi:membrane protease YdiL (CAAX protease family)